MYDQRLFNQEGGMASGLAADDTYNLYDKNLWTDRGSNLYKPRNADADEDGGGAEEGSRHFKPDKVRYPSSLFHPRHVTVTTVKKSSLHTSLNCMPRCQFPFCWLLRSSLTALLLNALA